jgi:molybdopterin-guanine dinucleotide biosynthesis protein A
VAPERVTGVVLAGGRATRFSGQPKGLERVGGQRIIDRVIAALRAATDDLCLVANDPNAHAWLPGIITVSDVRPGYGSLGGLHAALVHTKGPIIAVAWDMPFVTTPLFAALRAAHNNADVVVYESGSPRGVEPLCALYGPGCVRPIEDCMDAGDLRVVGFFDHVRVVRLPAPAHADVAFMNVNTPADLALAERLAAGQITG